jgi:hypothetical protein
MHRPILATVAAAAALTVTVGLVPACKNDSSRDRAALIVLAREGDPGLDEARAGCIVDGLLGHVNGETAEAILRTRSPATLAPDRSDVVAGVGLACSGVTGSIPPTRP